MTKLTLKKNDNAHHFQGIAGHLGTQAYTVFDSCTLVKWVARPDLVHTPVQVFAHLKRSYHSSFNKEGIGNGLKQLLFPGKAL